MTFLLLTVSTYNFDIREPILIIFNRNVTEYVSHEKMLYLFTAWRRGVVVSGVRHMNEVNARRARLVPRWVTVFDRVYHLSM